MKKFLLLLLLLLAATFVLRDQLWPGVHPNGELAPTAREADLATGNLTAAAATPTSTGAKDLTRTERRAAAGSLRVRALAQAKDGTTAPLPDLLVLAFPGEGSHESVDGVVHRLRTDDRGEAVFASLQPGTFSVRAPSARVATQHAVVAASGEAFAELRIEGADVVRGIVVDENGAPVEGADLWLVRDTRSDEFGVLESLELRSRRAGRSNANGTFAVLATDPSERRIAASHDVHGESMARYVQGGRHELRLVLQPATAVLQGSVRDARGAPVADATVIVEVGSQNARRTRDGNLVVGRRPFVASTDATGAFVIPRLPQGMSLAYTRTPPFRNSTASVELMAGRSARVELILSEGLLLHGTVRGTRGSLQKASVGFLATREAEHLLASTPVQPDGSYVLHIGPQEAQQAGAAPLGGPRRLPFLTVAVDDERIAIREIETRDRQSVRCDFVVDESLVTTGSLQDAKGEPLKDWRIWLEPPDAVRVVTRTDAKGTFVLASACPSAARAVVFAPGSNRPALVRDGVNRGDHLDLVVPEGAMPRGRVFGRIASASLPDYPFQLQVHHRVARVEHTCRSEADGSFAVEDLVEGSWTLQYLHHGTDTVLVDAIELADGEVRDLGTIALPPMGRLAVEVVDEHGQPWSGSTVGFRLHDAQGNAVAANHETIDGRLGLIAAPGTYLLDTLATDLLCERVPVTIEASRTERARLSLRVGRTLRLHFTSDAENGRGEARPLRVAIRDANGASMLDESLPRARALSGNRAFWQLSRTFPFGPHRIEAATEDGLRFAMDLDVTESFDTDPIVEVPVVR